MKYKMATGKVIFPLLVFIKIPYMCRGNNVVYLYFLLFDTKADIIKKKLALIQRSAKSHYTIVSRGQQWPSLLLPSLASRPLQLQLLCRYFVWSLVHSLCFGLFLSDDFKQLLDVCLLLCRMFL